MKVNYSTFEYNSTNIYKESEIPDDNKILVSFFKNFNVFDTEFKSKGLNDSMINVILEFDTIKMKVNNFKKDYRN